MPAAGCNHSGVLASVCCESGDLTLTEQSDDSAMKYLLCAMCRRILVVEQRHWLADRIALHLEGLGHQVRIACDGQAALVVAQNFRPEVVLVDASLDFVGGCRVTVGLRSVLGDPDLPIFTIKASHHTAEDSKARFS